jgi:hypothetical protein
MPSVDPAPIHAPSAEAHARLAADLSAFPVALRRPLIKVPMPPATASNSVASAPPPSSAGSPAHHHERSGDSAEEISERNHHGISAAFASGVRSACLRTHDASTGRAAWFRLKGCGNHDQVQSRFRVSFLRKKCLLAFLAAYLKFSQF